MAYSSRRGAVSDMSDTMKAVRNAIHRSVKQTKNPAYGLTPILWIEMGCRNSGCPAREVTIHVKDFDGVLLSRVDSEIMCPLCRRPMVLHGVETREEHSIPRG